MAKERVEGQDVLLVQCISDKPIKYNAKMIDKKTGEERDNKLFGQEYRLYNYGGKVFTSKDESFFTALEAGGVSVITLETDETGYLSVTGYITFKKIIGMKRNQVMVDLITPENFAVNAQTTVEDLLEKVIE